MEENTVGQTVRRFSQIPEVTEPLCVICPPESVGDAPGQ